eukprot:6421511-Pyramimonas_sp.AAC.1
MGASHRLHAGVTLGKSDLWCAAFWGPRGYQTWAHKPLLPLGFQPSGDPSVPASWESTLVDANSTLIDAKSTLVDASSALSHRLPDADRCEPTLQTE